MPRATLCLLLLAACRPPSSGDGTCHGYGFHACGGTGLDPDACGPLDANDTQRRIHTLLLGAAALDKATIDLDDTIHKTCLEMGAIIDVQADGDTDASCAKVATALDAALDASAQGKLVTSVTPGPCSADASIDLVAALRVTCAAPTIEVQNASITVTDSARFQQARNAIEAGLPRLLLAQKRMELAAPAVMAFTQAAQDLEANAQAMAPDLGESALCVASVLHGLQEESPRMQSKVTVSVDASVKIAASAGAQAQ